MQVFGGSLTLKRAAKMCAVGQTHPTGPGRVDGGVGQGMSAVRELTPDHGNRSIESISVPRRVRPAALIPSCHTASAVA